MICFKYKYQVPGLYQRLVDCYRGGARDQVKMFLMSPGYEGKALGHVT
jgi:hypothetical protein